MHLEGIILSLFYAALFGIWLYNSSWLKNHGFATSILLFAYCIKLIGSITQQALYTYYYTDRSTSDIYRFFDDGLILKSSTEHSKMDYINMLFNFNAETPYYFEHYYEVMNAWIKPFESGFYNDNHIMIKLNSLISWVGFDYYEVNGIIFTIAGFLGTLLLISTITTNVSKKNTSLILVSLFPSSALWLVGGLKETLLLFGLGLFVYAFDQLLVKRKLTAAGFIMFLLGSFVLLSVKLYFLFALIPALLAAALAHKLSLSLLKGLTIWLFLAFTGYFTLTFSGFEIIEFISAKQDQFINHMNETTAGSAIDIPTMEPTIWGVIKYIPIALKNTLMLPVIPSSAAEGLLMIENILFWLLAGYAFLQRKMKTTAPNWSAIFVTAFALSILVLIGITTPVLGAIMRYRSPILILMIMYISNYITIPFKFQSK